MNNEVSMYLDIFIISFAFLYAIPMLLIHVFKLIRFFITLNYIDAYQQGRNFLCGINKKQNIQKILILVFNLALIIFVVFHAILSLEDVLLIHFDYNPDKFIIAITWNRSILIAIFINWIALGFLSLRATFNRRIANIVLLYMICILGTTFYTYSFDMSNFINISNVSLNDDFIAKHNFNKVWVSYIILVVLCVYSIPKLLKTIIIHLKLHSHSNFRKIKIGNDILVDPSL